MTRVMFQCLKVFAFELSDYLIMAFDSIQSCTNLIFFQKSSHKVLIFGVALSESLGGELLLPSPAWDCSSLSSRLLKNSCLASILCELKYVCDVWAGRRCEPKVVICVLG